ncbi:HEPN/Toprim-associated domain-containing protein [Pseudomonas fluorescens]|uniref:HEPN/Toprim N-terminal domain-containing protein n=1 Tax=Pseudomonas fluorescens TaxID=294 RepID=A0A423LDP4_PSEFL|nr:HEPN/Toprim-associated domain-containing protein [Pseudomonas fluorescens]RON66426.1 hypothetical protein BK671_15670 [Pseudomonas fluorescens]
MSSWFDVKIGNYKVYENSSHCFCEWYFKKSERAIRENEILERTEYIYITPITNLKRRLALNGWDRNALELEFQQELPVLIEDIEYGREYHPDYANTLLALVKEMGLDDWIEKLKSIEHNNFKPYLYEGIDKYEDPVIDYMLCINRWYSERSQSFPCISDECLAVALFEFLPDDSLAVQNCTELVEAGSTDAFDDLIEYHQEKTNLFTVFLTSISEIEDIIHTTQENSTIAKLLFAGIITAMETYLSDTIKKLISRNPSIKRRYVQYEKVFDKNIKIQDIFRKLERLDKDINNAIDQTSFHNVETVEQLYREVLLVNFSEIHIPELKKAVLARHDIVHRNGKTFSGQQRFFQFNEVLALAALVVSTLTDIDAQVKDSLLTPDDIDF